MTPDELERTLRFIAQYRGSLDELARTVAHDRTLTDDQRAALERRILEAHMAQRQAEAATFASLYPRASAPVRLTGDGHG